jgi:hypothetical protein
MTSKTFDRIARALAPVTSRRRVLGVIGAAFGASVPHQSRAQLQPVSCSADGEVCTHLLGCCAGLVCATSYINTSYGICVPGEGDMVPVSTTLLTPGSDAMVAEAAAELAQLAAVESVDLHAERVAVLAERREKHDTQLTRKRTKRKGKRTRRQERRSRKGARQ